MWIRLAFLLNDGQDQIIKFKEEIINIRLTSLSKFRNLDETELVPDLSELGAHIDQPLNVDVEFLKLALKAVIWEILMLLDLIISIHLLKLLLTSASVWVFV
jgi:hypothetical protein